MGFLRKKIDEGAGFRLWRKHFHKTRPRNPLIGISGALTSSPLAVREAELASSLPVFSTDQLDHPELSVDLVFGEAIQCKLNRA